MNEKCIKKAQAKRRKSTPNMNSKPQLQSLDMEFVLQPISQSRCKGNTPNWYGTISRHYPPLHRAMREYKCKDQTNLVTSLRTVASRRAPTEEFRKKLCILLSTQTSCNAPVLLADRVKSAAFVRTKTSFAHWLRNIWWVLCSVSRPLHFWRDCWAMMSCCCRDDVMEM
jgi:hypothetical protein